jgi:hypothetical protein
VRLDNELALSPERRKRGGMAKRLRKKVYSERE